VGELRGRSLILPKPPVYSFKLNIETYEADEKKDFFGTGSRSHVMQELLPISWTLPEKRYDTALTIE
jgi:hypothetical protein